MSRLIDADALEREGWSLCRTFQEDKDTMVYEVKKPSDFPTIEERRRGKWINHRNDGGHNIADCDQCGETMQWYDPDPKPNYCPNCGAFLF